MKRDIINQLHQWKNKAQRKPLILQGARQVGKTFILQQFGHQHYDNVLYINFESQKKIHRYFDQDISPDKILEQLSLHFDHKIEPYNTLLIFDEIQECPRALNALKYFCESAPKYHIAAAGSLLGVKLSTHGFPVGKVDLMTLYPMSFFEFLSALNKGKWRNYLEGIQINDSIPIALHDELLEALKKYMVVGGMPESVQTYIDTTDYHEVREKQSAILRTYELDFSKHAAPDQNMKISQIWHSLPAQLAKENKKFIFSAIKKSARAREYQSSIEWLSQAGLIHPIYEISTPKIPLSGYHNNNAFKLYSLDVGLLGAMSDLPPKIILDGCQIFEEFKGAFTENYALQEIIATGKKTPYYWTSAGKAEVDFILQHELNAYPLEVKSGRNNHKKSLMVYQGKYQPIILSRATAMNLKHEKHLVNYPLYLISRFPFHI